MLAPADDRIGTPVSCQPQGSRPQFVVATYNINSGAGRDGTRNARRVAATLVGAQLIGLQEVDDQDGEEYMKDGRIEGVYRQPIIEERNDQVTTGEDR